METFLLYIIKSSFCLALLYIFFKALLSKETFFRFNRFVLLGGIVMSSILPFIILQTPEETAIQVPIRQVENFIVTENNGGKDELKETQLTINKQHTENSNKDQTILTPSKRQFPLTQSQILLLIYFLGLSVAFFGLFISIYKMIRLIHNGTKITDNKYVIVLVNQKICPFSFGKYIVLSETDYKQNPTEIITHELVHARKKHSLDLLFMEFFVLLHWFNPVIWLLKRELQDIHEYEADNGVINQGIDATKYQLLLVKKAVGARSYAIANSFNHSKIKNRITMMLRRKSTQWARLKLILFVPVAAVVLQAFARPEMTGIEETLLSSEVTTISQENQKWSKNYFDEKVDDFLKKMNDNTKKESKNWDYICVQLTDKTSYLVLPSEDSKGKIQFSKNWSFKEYDTEKLLDSLKVIVRDIEGKRMKKNLHSPSIVFLKIEKGTPEAKVQAILDALGNLSLEITKEREEQKKKAWENNVKTTFTEMYSKEPFFVVINERMNSFEAASGRHILLKETVKMVPTRPKETVKMTELVVVRDSSEVKSTKVTKSPKETVKMTELVVAKDSSKTTTKSRKIVSKPVSPAPESKTE